MIEETWRTEEVVREFAEKGYWGEEILTDHLEGNVRRFPDNVAVIDSKSRMTFRALAQRVDRLAIRLKELGIGKGDRVMMIIPDWIEVFCLRYALGRIGAICCIGSIDWRRREIEHAISLTQSVAVVIPRVFKQVDFLGIIQGISGEQSSLKHILLLDDAVYEGCLSLRSMMDEDLQNAYPPDYLAQFRASAHDIDKIQFTAGTTGPAKAECASQTTTLP